MESIWSKSCRISQRERLNGDIKTEVAVIGAGLAGILISHRLSKSGKKVFILEADRIASGQTCNTTAKITSQHGMIYSNISKILGEYAANQYAAANETAIREYRRIISSASIECDFEERDSYVYGNNESLLFAELESAVNLGLPADFVKNIPIPVPAAGAVRFKNQAQFNPLKFIKALSEELEIFEHTRVKSVEDNVIITESGNVQADHIVFASHYPFVNFPGLFFVRMHQERSYVIVLENAAQVGGMYVGAGKNSYSFRNYGKLLLLGGGNHRTGENSGGGRYDELREKARQWFPNSRETAHWSAQDCITPDGVPYIGKYAVSHPNWYVATGFQKWGMTSSMVSAMIIDDMICGRENPYSQVFSPGRFDSKTLSGVISEGEQSVKGLAKRFFQEADEVIAQIPLGHGGIVEHDGEKIGVYRNEQGQIFAVSIRCPHLGCLLEWNPDELSWDCPCHGSRFDYMGKLISGPAQTGISHR